MLISQMSQQSFKDSFFDEPLDCPCSIREFHLFEPPQVGLINPELDAFAGSARRFQAHTRRFAI
jgi:hypothetical protein